MLTREQVHALTEEQMKTLIDFINHENRIRREMKALSAKSQFGKGDFGFIKLRDGSWQKVKVIRVSAKTFQCEAHLPDLKPGCIPVSWNVPFSLLKRQPEA